MDGIEPERVEPADVAKVAKSLALLRGVSFEEVAVNTTSNARKLFGIAQ
jgi:TatD DNase family protein